MAPFQLVGIIDHKHAIHILLAFMTGQMRLAFTKHGTLQCLGSNGQMGDAANAKCQHLALVIASLALPFGRQRHWQQQVDIVKVVSHLHVRSHQPP